MLTYIIRRLLWMPILLFFVSLFTFTLGFYGPGDPVEVRLGIKYNPETAERLRTELGLDRPFLVQYSDYMTGFVTGDLGESLTKYPGYPVGQLIKNKIWISAQLGIAAFIVFTSLGIPLGLLAALKQGTWMDTAIVSFTLLFVSLPVFITAPFLILFFAVWLGWLPTGGWDGFFDTHIIMPALVLGLPGIAGLARLTRASTMDVLGQEYVRTARAKGLHEVTVQVRHVIKNAMIPIITVLGLGLGTLVEGAFIAETFFGIPGIGQLAVDSLFARDYPIIMALTLLVAISFVLANLMVDILYGYLDPRIRYT